MRVKGTVETYVKESPRPRRDSSQILKKSPTPTRTSQGVKVGGQTIKSPRGSKPATTKQYVE